MGDNLLHVDKEVHDLKFGTSFDPKPNVAFHSIKYDFKPASVDNTRDSLVEIGEGHQVTVTVPHVAGAGTTHTVYKGNKREVPKECVLIIDHKTGTFTLEKLSNNIMLKKTRIEGSSKVHSSQSGRPLTPVDVNKQKMSPAKHQSRSTPTQQRNSSPPARTPPLVTPSAVDDPFKDYGLSVSSGSDDSSDSELDIPDKQQQITPREHSYKSEPSRNSILKNDLQLSDPSSDSDSD